MEIKEWKRDDDEYQGIDTEICFPEDPTQVPDVCVYLLAGNDPICYSRIPAIEFVKRRNGGKPYWINLKADPAYQSISNTTVPGSVLLNVGFCPVKSVDDHVMSWQKQRQEALTTSYYELRVHVYQASDLPPADDDGSLDPYLKIKFADQKSNWKRKYIPNTRDPVWYCTEVFSNLLLPPRQYMPRIAITVWDHDKVTSDDKIGHVWFSPCDDRMIVDRAPTAMLPKPEWYPLCFEDGTKQPDGKLLLNFQLLPAGSGVSSLPEPLSIAPPMKNAWVEIVALGLRKLKPSGIISKKATRPFMRFKLGKASQGTRAGPIAKYETRRSNRPSAKNPNFLQRIVIPCRLPLDPLFAPSLNVLVCDSRLGGLSTKVIGSMSVHLAEKMPWCTSYVPPMTKSPSSGSSNPHMSQHLNGNEEAKYKELLEAARLTKKEARVLLNLCDKMPWKYHKDVQKATMLDLLHTCSANRRFNRMLGLDAALISDEQNEEDEEDSEEDLLDLEEKDEKKEEEEEEEEELDDAPSEQEVTLKCKGKKRTTVDLGREILKAKPNVLFGKSPSSTNWGYENSTLWVDKGFGAKFIVFLRPSSSSSNARSKKKSNIVLSGPKRIQMLLQSISKSGFVSRADLEHMLRKELGILQDQEGNAKDQKMNNEREAERRVRLRKERFAKPPSRKQVKALKVVFESVSSDDGTSIPELLSKCSEDHAVASAFQFHKHTYVTVNHVDLKRLGTAARMIEEQPVHALTWNQFTSHFMQKRSDIEYLLRLYALSRPTQRRVLDEIALRATSNEHESMILYPGGLMQVSSNDDNDLLSDNSTKKLSTAKMNTVQEKALRNIFEEYVSYGLLLTHIRFILYSCDKTLIYTICHLYRLPATFMRIPHKWIIFSFQRSTRTHTHTRTQVQTQQRRHDEHTRTLNEIQR